MHRTVVLLFFKLRALIFGVALLSGTQSVQAQSFEGLGDLPGGPFFSRADAISSDGKIVVGVSWSDDFRRSQGFRWENGSMVALPSLPIADVRLQQATPYAISDDGRTIVGGSLTAPVITEPAQWVDGVIEALPLPVDGESGFATAISPDGTIAVGSYRLLPGSIPPATRGMRWDNGVGQWLPNLAEYAWGYAQDVSADGEVIVGFNRLVLSGSGDPVAVVWTNNIPSPLTFPALRESNALRVSDDGSVIALLGEEVVGTQVFTNSYRWENGEFQNIGSLGNETIARDMSADGRVIVGRDGSRGGVAFIWDEASGIRSLKAELEDMYGLDLTGWTLTDAFAVSADGLTVAGYGYNPAGDFEAWRAVLPPRSPLFYSIDVSNAEPAVGDEFDVVLSVANEGTNPVTDVIATVARAQNSIGNADLLSGPEPAVIPTIEAGASSDISFRYVATAQGVLRLEISIEGMDAGGTVSATARCLVPGKAGATSATCTDEIPINGDLVVNSTADSADNDLTDGGICSTGETVMLDAETEVDECTLRAAIQTANSRPGKPAEISFAIPGSDAECETVCRITVETPLDPLSVNALLNATTQPGFSEETPVIVLQAGMDAKSGAGLFLEGNRGGVGGFAVTGFEEAGIKVTGDENQIAFNIVGKTKSDLAPLPSRLGIWIKGGDKNYVGRSDPQETSTCFRNRLSGNSETAVLISHGSSENVVECNLIGPNFDDDRLDSNGHGIRIEDSPSNLVVTNSVRENAGIGVHVVGAPSVKNQIATNAIQKNNIGVQIESASSNTLGQKLTSTSKNVNVIAKNVEVDVLIVSDNENAPANDNLVHRNAIGADPFLRVYEDSDTKLGLMIAGWASNNLIGPFFDEPGDYSNVIGGQVTANIAIVGPSANGNRILSGLIGIGLGEADDLSGTETNIVIALANNTQIGSLSSLIPFPSITMALATSNGIFVEGSSSGPGGYPGVPGFPSIGSGGSGRSTGTNIQGVAFAGFRSRYPSGTFLDARRVDSLQLGPSVDIASCNSSGAIFESFKDIFVVGTKFRVLENPLCYGNAQDGDEEFGVFLCVGDGAQIGSGGSPLLRNEFYGYETGVLVQSSTPCNRDGDLTQNVRIENNVFGVHSSLPPLLSVRNDTGIRLSHGAFNTVVGGSELDAGNYFLNNGKGVVLQAAIPKDAPAISQTLIQSNWFGVDENGRPSGGNDTAIEVRHAINTRIGSETIAVPSSPTGRNTFSKNRRVVAVFDPVDGERGTSILSNSIYGNDDDGILGSDGLVSFLQDPLRFPLVSIVAVKKSGSAYSATGQINGRPNEPYLVQYFGSDACKGVNEARDFVATYTVRTDESGIGLLSHAVELNEGAGLTAATTDLSASTTGMLSQCYTVGQDTVLVAEIDTADPDPTLEDGDVVVELAPASGKSAVTDTLYASVYLTAPSGINMSGTAATAHSGLPIVPASPYDRYWRIETGRSASETTMDLCMATGTLSDAGANAAVVIQRNRQTSGLWRPFDTRIEIHESVRYACASGLTPTGEFSLGVGSLASLSSPELTQPLDGSTEQGATSTLEWGAVSGAVAYQAQIASSAIFDLLETDTTGFTSTSLTLSLTQPFTAFYWRVRAQDEQSNWGPWSKSWVFQTTYNPVGTEDGAELPSAVELDQNFPNPFRHSTMLGFSLPEAAEVRVEVYNAIGQRIELLHDGFLAAGRHQIRFDGNGAPSGVYFYRLSAGTAVLTGTMLRVK